MGAFLYKLLCRLLALQSTHTKLMWKNQYSRLPANRGAANQNKIVFILPTHRFSCKVLNYLKYKLPANSRVGLGSGKMWHGDI